MLLVGALALLFGALGLLFVNWSRRQRGWIGFFHPYCNDGGGGERVLWSAVESLLRNNHQTKVAIYTGDNETAAEIVAKVNERFGILVNNERLLFVRLRWRKLLEARNYPVLTLLGQSFGSAILALEALYRFVPSVFVDTTGCAFTYPLARFLYGCRVACYVHYPTISTDMLSLVSRREESYNNRPFISRSLFLTSAKLIYYRFFALAYGLAGRCSHIVMCNSSWTCAHIREIWRINPIIVFPPCNTEKLQSIPLDDRELLVISIGQFRPEKNHLLQLEAFDLLRRQGVEGAKLAIIGSCRNAEDEARANELRHRVQALGMDDAVHILVNVPSSELIGKWQRRARAGLHTMRNEHFGISVVEFMAAGVVPIAHRSGGPLQDIVVDHDGGPTGYLAATAEEYAAAMRAVMLLDDSRLTQMQRRARASAGRFSDESFQAGFVGALAPLLALDSSRSPP